MRIRIYYLLATIFVVSLFTIVYFASNTPTPPTLIQQYGDNTFKAIGIYNSAIINATFFNKPINLTSYVYNENMNLRQVIFSSQIFNVTSEKKEKLYIKNVFIAHFEEGGEEIRYTWVLIEINPSSQDTLNIDISYSPTIWEENPAIKW